MMKRFAYWLLLAAPLCAFGAQQTVNRGTVAGDGTGEQIFTAWGKTNANFTELYGFFPVSVANGGTALSSFATGDILYASAANTLSALAKSTSSTRYLSNTGTSNVPAWAQIDLTTGVTGVLPVANGGTGQNALSSLTANPTASVGLTAVNGSASTFMRSDGAPALDQTIVPTMTGIWTWSLAEPRQIFIATGGGTDGKKYDIDVTPTLFSIRTRTDADGTGQDIFTATRTAASTALTNVKLGYAVNGTYSFPFTGLATFGGPVTIGGTTTFGVSYSITTGGTTQLGNITNTTGTFITSPGFRSSGTKFTTSACSISSTTGGATAGVFTLGANSCTAVITLNGATGITATNGWSCQAHDRTAPTVLIGGESSSSATTASFTIPAGAGATDVISYSCVGY